MQCLSVPVQRGNTVCVIDTASSTSSLDNDVDLLDLLEFSITCCCFRFSFSFFRFLGRL